MWLLLLGLIQGFSALAQYQRVQWDEFRPIKEFQKSQEVLYFIKGRAPGYSHIRILKGQIVDSQGEAFASSRIVQKPSDMRFTGPNGEFQLYLRIAKSKLPVEIWAASEINGDTFKNVVKVPEERMVPIATPETGFVAKNNEFHADFGIASMNTSSKANNSSASLNGDGSTGISIGLHYKRTYQNDWSLIADAQATQISVESSSDIKDDKVTLTDFKVGGRKDFSSLGLSAHARYGSTPLLRTDGSQVDASTAGVGSLGGGIHFMFGENPKHIAHEIYLLGDYGMHTSEEELDSSTSLMFGAESKLWLSPVFHILGRFEYKQMEATLKAEDLASSGNTNFDVSEQSYGLFVGAGFQI